MVKDFVAIDFETARALRATANAVGCVKFIDCKPVGEFYTLIQPPWELCEKYPMLTEIHGITDGMLLDQPTWTDVLPKLEEFVEGLPLVAHNASVERGCIEKCCEYYGLSTSLDYEHIADTLKLTKEVEKKLHIKLAGSGARRLDTLMEMYQCSTDDNNHHNALWDSYGCGYLYVKMQKINEAPADKLSLISRAIKIPVPKIEYHRIFGTTDLKELLLEQNNL